MTRVYFFFVIIISHKIWYTKEIIKPKVGQTTSWQKLAKLCRDLTPNSHQICFAIIVRKKIQQRWSTIKATALSLGRHYEIKMALNQIYSFKSCLQLKNASPSKLDPVAAAPILPHQPILDQPRALNVVSMSCLGRLRSNYSGRRVNTFTHGHAGSLNNKKFWTGVQQLPNYSIFQPGRAGTWQLLGSVDLQFLRALGASQSIFRLPSAFASRLYR